MFQSYNGPAIIRVKFEGTLRTEKEFCFEVSKFSIGRSNYNFHSL